MWKNATRIVLKTFIVVGIIGTILATLLVGLFTYLTWGLYAVLLNSTELENIALTITIIMSLLTGIAGACFTFMGATSIGLKLEVAEDIEQIRINTTPKEPETIPEEELDVNKYIYPYQYNNVYNRKDS